MRTPDLSRLVLAFAAALPLAGGWAAASCGSTAGHEGAVVVRPTPPVEEATPDDPAVEPTSTRAGRSRRADGLELGMNLSVMNARNRELTFVDAFRGSSNWELLQPGEQPGQRRRPAKGHADDEDMKWKRGDVLPFELDPTGWPRLGPQETAVGMMFQNMDGHYPGGRYVCTWEGKGRVDFQRAGRIVEREPNRLVVEVDPAQGPVIIRYQSPDPEDPVRKLRFWMPGFEKATSAFHPLLIERLRPFSVIRFGNWARTNFSDPGGWDERTTPDSMTQTTPRGVALEYMVDLCNELEASPWFCIGFRADDRYVRNFALLVRERLKPGIPIRVEFSNEVWNPIFPQSKWAREQAKEKGLRPPQVTADESLRIWRIWREVFADEPERVVRVAAGHIHNESVARAMLERLDGEVDAFALGAYFGLKAEKQGLSDKSTVEEIMAVARKNLDELVLPRIAAHKALLEEHGKKSGHPIRLVAYEGGQHIVASRALGTADRRLALDPQTVFACQVSPRMTEAYRVLLSGVAERGMELFLAYDLAGRRMPGDTFGHLEYLSQPLEEAPKYRVLLEELRR